ncbi:MAG: indolepyruvate oxidoreductase subunit beta [Saccharofermentans sp.]|nr:indolepyruvate oxidoreductase subunit beta [Saccharofermentans sp.]
MGNLEASIVLAGVGGQGTLIAGKLLGILALKLGLDVKVSEVHGMSQRGGSVITYVKIGQEVHSPIIEDGTADYILAFEQVESVRWASLLKDGGVMIINNQQIESLPVLMGQVQYPENIVESMRSLATDGTKVVDINALDIATEIGTSKVVNIVMLGALSNYLGVDEKIWKEAIEEAFAAKPKTIPGNIKAFERGREEGA